MMRQNRLTRETSQSLIKPQGAHLHRSQGRRASGPDNDVILPGASRRVRQKSSKTSELVGDKTSSNPPTTVTRATSRSIITKPNNDSSNGPTSGKLPNRKCDRGACANRKSTDEGFVKAKVVVPGPQAGASATKGRSTGFGYKPTVDKLFIDTPALDSEEGSGSESEEDPVKAFHKQVEEDADKEARAIETQRLRSQYEKMCKMDHVTPSGRFRRQISEATVDISQSSLGVKELKGICVALTSNIHIKDLDLSGNDLSGKGAKYVAEGIRENTSVNELAIAHCNIDLDGLKEIADVFLDMKPMKRLDISCNKFSVRHAEIVSEVIRKNDYIEDLDLSGNEFDDQSGVMLGKAIVNNVGLKKLDLSWNHLRRDGAKSVCLALKSNTTLEELDLSWNGLAEEGCRALGEALPHNHTLRDLDISCNRINIFALGHFLKGLANNDTLAVLRIDQNPLTTDGAIGIMKTLTQSTCSQLTDVHMIDIPINGEFMDTLEELLKVRKVKVYHRDPNRKRITPILRDRTLGDFDPAMILFEYMKQENLRLIDLFRTFDTDGDQSVSKEELKEGFMTINMPLSDGALETLFDKLDLDENDQIDYDEVKVSYRKTMRKIRATDDVTPHNEAAVKILRQLVQEAMKEKRELMKTVAKSNSLRRRSSLMAVFQIRRSDSEPHSHWKGYSTLLILILLPGTLAGTLIRDSEYKVGYRKAMRKLRRRSKDANQDEAVCQLKRLVSRALKEKRIDESLLRGHRKRQQRQASLTAVFAVAGDTKILKQLIEHAQLKEDTH